MAANNNTLEISINGASCSAVVTAKGRLELRVIAAGRHMDRGALFTRIGQEIRNIARGLTSSDVLARTNTGNKAASFCRKAVRGATTGELLVFAAHSPRCHVAHTL